MYLNSVKFVKWIALTAFVVGLMIAPAKPAQAQTCNPICARILLNITCYQPTSPWKRLPNDIESGWYYEAHNGLFHSNGSLIYHQASGVYRQYRTNLFTNWPAGTYQVRVKQLPLADPPMQSAWIYESVNVGGLLAPVFEVMYSPSHPVCN